jgi:hypothetical protein
VKLLREDRDAGKFTFRFEQAEREWFRTILLLYPVHDGALNEVDDAVAKAVAEGRKKLAENAELFLKAGKIEIDADFTESWDLTLSAPEIEELLQILNNVRVGLWIRLGKPNPEKIFPGPATEQMVRDHMMMHVCAAWQNGLMAAVDGEPEGETTPE